MQKSTSSSADAQPADKPAEAAKQSEPASPLIQPLEVNPEVAEEVVKSEQADQAATAYSKKTALSWWLVVIVVILVGIASGWPLANYWVKTQVYQASVQARGGQTDKANQPAAVTEAGINDPKLFADTAEGKLQANDTEIDEGTHVLIRPGGPSQTVYLTSSAVDLSQFEGREVMVRGRTLASQKAGWFMEVGYVKLK